MRFSRRDLRERNRRLTEKVLDTLPDEVLEICAFDWQAEPRNREAITEYLKRASLSAPPEYRPRVEGLLRVLEARFWLFDQSDAHEGATQVQLRSLAASLVPSQSLTNDHALRLHLIQHLPEDATASHYAASAADC